MSTTQVFVIAIAVLFPLWLYWMSDRAKNPVLLSVIGIPLFVVVALIIWALIA